MKVTKNVQYHTNPIINAITMAALTGDKKVRADLAGILPELLRARNDELRVYSEVRKADSEVRVNNISVDEYIKIAKKAGKK